MEVECAWCGKRIKRYGTQIKAHNFCSRQCMNDFASKEKNPEHYTELKDFTNLGKHLPELNKKLNPERMTPETREKIRNARLGMGEGKGYAKKYGRHEHRLVAEQILGRPLRPGEVVHHMDGNKRNNNPENLRVFSSQAEHARFHDNLRWFIRDLEEIEKEEVMPDEVRTL